VTDDRTAAWYERFATFEARGQSAIYEDWATGVAGDEEVLALIRTLPRPKQQPNLVFAVSRLFGAPERGFAEWKSWLVANWATVETGVATRSTQTNEPRRCAVLLPFLAELPGPLALLEVGAAAGLCLYPDRYSYRYDDGALLHPLAGESSVLLECSTDGRVPIPAALPEVVWRGGIDLAPLALDSVDDMTWLETLIWPEQHARRARIRAAIEIARAEPPRIIAGDANHDLARLVDEVPDDATLVIFHSGVLVYMSADDRQRFVDRVQRLDATWISNEGPTVVPGVTPAGTPPGSLFALAVDGHLRARTGPHGQSIALVGA
jgi:hypothetical protein